MKVFRNRTATDIEGTKWLNDDRKAVPDHPENHTVQFREDGTIHVKADGNQKGGTYSISAEVL